MESNVALTDRIERLQAHNAMLVAAVIPVLRDRLDRVNMHPCDVHDDAMRARHAGDDVEALFEALNATTESIQQWLTEHDKEVRNKALAEFIGLNLKK